MQKKIIAIAIASLSGVAFAQSNVTISGQMRVGFENVSASGATAGGAANNTSRNRVVDDNSNIKFAGEEALGNGTSAWFQIESAIGTDNNRGTSSGNTPSAAQVAGLQNTATIGTRNTAVGLKGNWGTFLMGKWDAHYTSHAGVEAAGLADGLALGSNSLSLLHTLNTTAGTGGGRLDNVVAYVSPSFSGFSGLFAYSTSPTANEATTAGILKDSGWNLQLKYSNGPVHVFWSHLRVENAGSVDTDTTGDRLGAAYTFPMGLKVGLIYDKGKIALNAAGTNADRNAWALPISYRTGAHNFSFTYAKANDVKGNSAISLANTNAKMTVLGYEYSLSKRTSVSASYSQINNDSAGMYDFWHPSSSVGGGLAAAAVAAGADPRKLHFGVVHKF